MSTTPQDRAEHVMNYLGLPSAPELKRQGGRTYENWLYGDYFLRISPHPKDRLLVREYAFMRKLPATARTPKMVSYGVDGVAEWIIMRKAEGVRLTEAWITLSTNEREAAITQLGAMLNVIHHTAPPPELDNVYAMAMQLKRLQETIHEANQLPYVDPLVLESASRFIRQKSLALGGQFPQGVIHGDLHFDNLLWDGAQISAIVDFEHVQTAALDLELDVLLRFLVYPQAYINTTRAAALQFETHAFQIVQWLRQSYPALFESHTLADRLDLYSLVHDFPLLLTAPLLTPKIKRATYPEHPYHRIIAVLEGTSHRRLLGSA